MREEVDYASPVELEDTISGLDSGLFNCTFGLLAVGFNTVLLIFLNPETDYLIWILLNILAAFTFHILILARKRRKFRRPISNYELDTLLAKAKDRLDISRKIELWSTDDNGFVLANTTNLLFSSIIMSNSVVTKLLEKPDSGEIVLADEVLRIDNGPRKFSFVWDFMHYCLFSTATFALQETFFQFLLPVGIILIQTVIILLALSLITFTIYSRHVTLKPNIESVYGKTRYDAEQEVFGKIDRGMFPFFGKSMSRARIDESSEFRLGMLPAPFVISLICGIITYAIFTTLFYKFSEVLPFLILPLSFLFASIGFAFSFELINPLKHEHLESFEFPQNPPFEDEQSQSLMELLHGLPQYTEFSVRKRKTLSDCVVIEIGHEGDALRNHAIISDAVSKTLDPEELLVYAIAQIKRNDVTQKENKNVGRFLGIISLLVFLCGISALIAFQLPLLEFVILILFLYGALLVGSIALMTMRIHNKCERVDLAVQREYPSFYSILEKVQNQGNIFEAKQHKERFGYLERKKRADSKYLKKTKSGDI